MLKRTTKVTSLLVAAASIISMVPAMAADVKKVESIEGTVYQAKAEPGSTYIDAELNGKDEAVYVYRDGKYTKLDGAEPGDKFGDIFNYDGKTYLQMADGDYFVNVANGERTDDDIKENVDDDADAVLRKLIKSDNDGRFDKDFIKGNIVSEIDHDTSKTLFGGATCRRYNYKLANPVKYNNNYTKSVDAVYSDEKGNYVDGDYNLGNIGVYNSTGAGVTIKNAKDTYKLEVNGTKYEIKAEIQHLDSFTVDSNYITRTAALSIWGTTNNGGTYTNLTSDVYFGSASNKHKQATGTYTDRNGNTVDCTSIRVMQRISKAQASDKIDGIKYAKDVKTYFITDEDGKTQPLLGFANTFSPDGHDNFTNVGNDSKFGFGWITGGASGYIVSQYRDITNQRQYAETVNFKSSNGYNYTDIGDADDVKVAYVDKTNPDTYAYAIGAGDHYVLSDDGYIEEFIGKDDKWEKLYKVDGGMNKISISLPMFAAVWNEEDEIYSLITPGAPAGDKKDTTAATDTKTATDETTKTSTTTTVAAKAGWVKAADGTWSFVKADGTKATAWLQDGTTWYYLNATGVMQTGWVNDNGTWYYCNGSGAMLANTTVGGYVLGANGAWIK